MASGGEIKDPDELYKKLNNAESKWNEDGGAEYRKISEEIKENRKRYFERLNKAESNWKEDDGAEYKSLMKIRNKMADGGFMYEGGGSLDIDSFADGGELKKNYLVTFDSQTDEYAPTTFQSTSVYDLMETLKATIPAEVEILSVEEMTPSMEMKYGGVAGY
jgi:hypothetical protein